MQDVCVSAPTAAFNTVKGPSGRATSLIPVRPIRNATANGVLANGVGGPRVRFRTPQLTLNTCADGVELESAGAGRC